MRSRSLFLPVLVLLALGGFLLAPASASAHANLTRSEPSGGTAVPVAPAEIRVWFSENPEPRYSEIRVYDANLQRYEQGVVALITGDPTGLVVAVKPLPQGIYTVTWKALSAVDGHTTEGSFAFSVGNTPPPPTVGIAEGTQFTLPTPAEIIVKWLTILAATALAGALGLRLFVWAPALRAAGLVEVAPNGPFDRRVGRRLTLLAGGALLLLFLSTVAGLLLQVAKVTNRSVGGVLGDRVLSDFLFQTRAGGIWSVRLLIPVVALMLLAPLFSDALRRRPRRADEEELITLAPIFFGAALGAGYLLTISLTSHSAASPLWVIFSIALDWVHLLGTAVWAGGLLGLVATVPLVRDLGGALRPVLAGVVSRFSAIATGSIAVLAATGLYSAWLHVSSLDALWPTDYGRALLGKLALFALLIALGAFNHFWVRPRLNAAAPAPAPTPAPKKGAQRRAPAEPADRPAALLLRYFGRSVRAEAIIAVVVLLVVAVLTGFVPAREAIVQARAPKRTQTITAGDLRLTLTLATLQPGDNTCDILVQNKGNGRPVTDAERVALRITHAGMDMGEAEAVAASRGDGHYVASGPYLSMSGDWHLRAIVRRANVLDVDATFTMSLGSAANLAAAADPPRAPQLPRLNSERGLGLVALALGVILTVVGVRLFRRGSGFGTALLMVVPTALIVGGYLVYNGSGNEPLVNRPAEPKNPVTADATSIARGQALFGENCLVCHGPQGRADGPQAPALNPRPPDFTQPHTAYHSDGYLFNAITDGFPGSAMPAWGDTFTVTQRWDLVNYIRQFNPLTANGATPPPFSQLPTAVPTPASQALPTATQPRAAPPAVPTPQPGGASPGAAPGGAAPSPAAASAAPSGNGRLIHAFDGSIWAIDATDGRASNLIPDLGRDSYAGDPAVSPDAATIAYTVVVVPAPPPAGAPRPELPGSDLWLMNATGGGNRRLLVHDRPGSLIELPTWTPDGRALIFTYTAPVLGADGRYLSSIKELRRLDVATGAVTTLVKDAESAGLAPAGSAPGLAYVQSDPQTLVPFLFVAGADGSNGRRIIGPDAPFLSIKAPRFSPDGKRIVFAAAGGPVDPGNPARPPGGRLPGRVLRWLAAPFVTPLVLDAAAHGPPAELWMVNSDGSGLRRLTSLSSDDPIPAWSPDGKRIAFLTGSGLFIMPAEGGNPTKVSDRGSYSGLNWSPR